MQPRADRCTCDIGTDKRYPACEIRELQPSTSTERLVSSVCGPRVNFDPIHFNCDTSINSYRLKHIPIISIAHGKGI